LRRKPKRWVKSLFIRDLIIYMFIS